MEDKTTEGLKTIFNCKDSKKRGRPKKTSSEKCPYTYGNRKPKIRYEVFLDIASKTIMIGKYSTLRDMSLDLKINICTLSHMATIPDRTYYSKIIRIEKVNYNKDDCESNENVI